MEEREREREDREREGEKEGERERDGHMATWHSFACGLCSAAFA